MSSTNTIRQPKGRPVGGRFAEKFKDEGDVILPTQEILDEVAAPAPIGLSDREILDQSIKIARTAAFRVGLSKEDADDIAQDTVYSVLMMKSRNGGQPVKGGLIRVSANALVSRRVDTHKRHEDSKAFARWKRQADKLQNDLGRHLTTKELDELAVQIREDWENPRHRPSTGFQYETKVVSSDALGAAFGDTLANPEIRRAAGSEDAHYLADQLDNKKVSVAEVRNQVWNLIADDLDVAPAIIGATTVDDAKALRRVKSAVDVAEAFKQGIESPEVDALFLPFGPLTPRQKGAIANAIVARPKVGHKLWLAARDFSAGE